MPIKWPSLIKPSLREDLREIRHTLHHVTHNTETIMATQAQHAADLDALRTQVAKSRGEVLKKIADLEAAIENSPADTTPEVDAALQALKQEVQASDDVVPDQP